MELCPKKKIINQKIGFLVRRGGRIYDCCYIQDGAPCDNS